MLEHGGGMGHVTNDGIVPPLQAGRAVEIMLK